MLKNNNELKNNRTNAINRVDKEIQNPKLKKSKNLRKNLLKIFASSLAVFNFFVNNFNSTKAINTTIRDKNRDKKTEKLNHTKIIMKKLRNLKITPEKNNRKNKEKYKKKILIFLTFLLFVQCY
ncbi:MAG: hypothetical protein LBJ32_00840 [Oscillospiraceae bacterium]|nr:hypothetical protein [Oscillospiraceae bacterium]